MPTPKAIFFDLDGTLLSWSKMLDSSKEALVYAREKGVKIFVATGRNRGDIEKMPWFEEVTFDGFVAMNGTHCYVGDEVIYKKTLEKDAVRLVVDFISTTQVHCVFCEADEMYTTAGDEDTRAWQASMGLPTPPVSDASRALCAEIFQIVSYGSQLKTFVARHPQFAITGWSEDCYDIIPAGASKWDGILHMLPRFGLKPWEIATVGDGHNDIEMLTNAEFSVAMGNASDEVKACAKHVTGHVDAGGALMAVKFLLGCSEHPRK